MSISVLLTNLVGLFLMIGVGFFAVRAGILSSGATVPLTALLMKITLPATIFSSMLRPFEASFLGDALLMFVLGLVFHLSYVVLSQPLLRLFRVPRGRRGMWTLCSSFCNNGFMGFPVAYALFGEEGLALAVMLGVPFNLLLYSLGAKLAADDGQKEEETGSVSWKKVLFSAVNGSILLGLVFYCLQIPVPDVLLTPIQYLSDVTTPLSMLVTGMNLAEGKLTDALLDRDVRSICLMRLLLFPIVTWGVVELLPIGNPLAVGVVVVIMAMPCAAATVVVGEEYDGCVELGARAVFVSSLLCIVTLPLISLLL